MQSRFFRQSYRGVKLFSVPSPHKITIKIVPLQLSLKLKTNFSYGFSLNLHWYVMEINMTFKFTWLFYDNTYCLNSPHALGHLFCFSDGFLLSFYYSMFGRRKMRTFTDWLVFFCPCHLMFFTRVAPLKIEASCNIFAKIL